MTGIGTTPSRSMAAENVRNLQNWTGHQRRASGGRLVLVGLQIETFQRAHDCPDGVGGDARVERRALDLGMTKQS